ncbi:GNAT family protein [uncultured Shewanella sp.]|uniref:GNAT family N-acetyltransferase n=1 Tax=uncultured Shewanella sp. TaxID=173975 RepID=UPI002638055B|nr:GNAT family protein [uncultured Shewanella sp.]
MSWLNPVNLVGQYVSLEVLTMDHLDGLKEAVLDGESWRLWYANVPSPETMSQYIQKAIMRAEEGELAFAVRCLQTQKIVGTTRYYHVDAKNKRARLGYTWYAQSVRKTPINTESKFLLLQHLFDNHKAMAVEFRTHFFNQASRKAIERLGAKQDGILRCDQIMRDGSIRDTVVYSILGTEWGAVKNNLRSKLNR